MTSVRPKLPRNNSEDELHWAEWGTLHQCFAAWVYNSLNPVLGTRHQSFLSWCCFAVQVCVMLMGMLC